MYRHWLPRTMVSLLGAGFVAVGLALCAMAVSVLIGRTQFSSVPEELRVISTKSFKKSSNALMESPFNLCTSRNGKLVVVGDIKTVKFLKKSERWDALVESTFGDRAPVYEGFESVVGYGIKGLILGVVTFLFGGLFIAIARDLWLYDHIVSHHGNFWVLFAKRNRAD